MPCKKVEDFNFEKSLDYLTILVEQMEQGDLPLEESLERFETGMRLVRECQKALETAEQQVKVLINQSGKEILTPFHPESKNND
ncbi:exodeoxyribonuclease VII small subunit [Coxiella endosymbiont of Amblyomma nuttalli]|uniref:exodeoxyribonuclease VII small subunit n=1 Tax=Coxiella endosymbiont of Amblyomma nuttalli TaxID=2749996 RepID=UPI001BAA4E1C|nr:exodeoxyribonuclease VII small subunit [Coxiella endosymbiont of Amblyomma nuttalli]